jgi:hypothetical protein
VVLEETETAVTQERKLNPKSISWGPVKGILMLLVRRVLDILLKKFKNGCPLSRKITRSKY